MKQPHCPLFRSARCRRMWLLELISRGLAVLLACSVAAAGPAQPTGMPPDWEEFIRQGMEAWQLPGLAVAVVKDGAAILEQGYGVREAETDQAVDAETLFAIGSTTKAFTSAALGRMVDEKKTEWSAKIRDIRPDVRFSDPWVTDEIRVSDLLANHSGLGLLSEALWYGSGKNREQILAALENVPFEEGFRYSFQYRNVMFLLAGELLPQLAGQSWEDTLKETFFKPLGMTRTLPTDAGLEREDNVARPHLIDYDGKPLPVSYRAMDNIAPAGSIISCVQDLVPWMLLHLQNGEFGGQQMLQPETVAFMHRSQTPLATVGPAGQALFPPAELRSYALGWVTESYRGRRIVWHNGGIDGMSAWIGLVPELGLGVAILSNLEECDLRNAIFYRLVDHYAGEPPLDLLPGLVERHRQALAARDARQRDWEELQEQPVSAALDLPAYAGTYRNPAMGEARIAVEDGRLVYFRTPQQTIDLLPEGGNRFLGKYRDRAEDLRSGKLSIEFKTVADKVTGFVEDGIIEFAAAPAEAEPGSARQKFP